MAFPPLFSHDDCIRAYEEWGANCGPTALAAMTLQTLDEVRPLMGDFEQKHYTNPTLMWATLNRIGATWQKLMHPEKWPRYGLALIQFEGPWTAPNVPARAAYRHTHWIGVDSGNPDNIGIYDCNAMNNGSGWVSAFDWEHIILPYLLEEIPKANGKWHIKCAAEIDQFSLIGRVPRI
jgi:hypothetical protein